jgi:hypothetical protein
MLGLFLVASCRKAGPVPPADVPVPVDAPVSAPAPAWMPPAPVPPTSCRSSSDCPEGAVCEGEGCGDDAPGTCTGLRACTRDLRQYCGCDGVTFLSSGSCPGRRFAHRGPCP